MSMFKNSFQEKWRKFKGGLRDMDITSVSDPVCILYQKNTGQMKWTEAGRTEVIKNNLNPSFVKKFRLNYFFEEKLYLRFELYDVDDEDCLHKDLSKQDYLGDFECTLGKLVSILEVTAPLGDSKTNKKPKGTITVTAEMENATCREQFVLSFQGENLHNSRTLFTISPYFIIYKIKEDEEGFVPVWRSETKPKTINPEWSSFTISFLELCNACRERVLRITCYDDKNGGDKEIGTTDDITAQMLLDKGNVFKLTKKARDRGKLIVSGHTMSKPNFMDYLQNGMDIAVTVAVDFTKSNGDPMSPTSRHYHAPNGILNIYGRAIQAVVPVLDDYNRTKRYTAFGFGAKDKVNGQPLAVFPLNGNEDDPSCDGVKGVFEAYYTALQRNDLFCPTYFAPIINRVCKKASEYPNGSVYQILLILTDGIIEDMAETRKAIVEAADQAMSIIIIGIGEEDFSAMELLDGDNKRVAYKRKAAARDIVQFVEFRKYDSYSQTPNVHSNKYLANEVLLEIPDQVVSYMSSKKIKPGSFSRGSVLV